MRWIAGMTIGFSVLKVSAAVFGESAYLEAGLAHRSDIVFYGGFEQYAPGSSAWNAQWGIAFNNRIANATLVSGADAVVGEKAIRIDYPQGGVGPTQTGMQFPIAFSKIQGMTPVYDSLYLRYYVYFEPGFDFKLGGKLPGLMGGGNSWARSGGDQPSGSNGWTMRFMWRSGGEAVVYAYLPGGKYKQGDWGTDIKLNRTFQTGKWHCIEQFIKINTPGADNGKLYVWLDNERVLSLEDVRYLTVLNDSGRVGGIYVSTFHGGNDASWAPTRTSYARFDGFVAALNRVGPASSTLTLTIRTLALPQAVAGLSYQAKVDAENGQEPYTFSLQSGSLPAGLQMNASGEISGRPTVSGNYNLTFLVRDANGAQATRTLALRVSAMSNLANQWTLTAYSQNLDLNNPIQGLFDGDTSGTPAGSPGSQAAQSMFAEFDFQGVYRLNEVKVFGDADGSWICAQYRVQTKMQASAAWEDLIPWSACNQNRWYVSTVQKNAAFLRLDVQGAAGSNKVQIRELVVSGQKEGETPVRRYMRDMNPKHSIKTQLFDMLGRVHQ